MPSDKPRRQLSAVDELDQVRSQTLRMLAASTMVSSAWLGVKVTPRPSASCAGGIEASMTTTALGKMSGPSLTKETRWPGS